MKGTQEIFNRASPHPPHWGLREQNWQHPPPCQPSTDPLPAPRLSLTGPVEAPLPPSPWLVPRDKMQIAPCGLQVSVWSGICLTSHSVPAHLPRSCHTHPPHLPRTSLEASVYVSLPSGIFSEPLFPLGEVPLFWVHRVPQACPMT